MIFEIVFPNSTFSAPVLIFRDGEKICRCQRPRWVQLFALMVHRDRNGIGQNFVTAGDLENLLAFRGTSLSSSVKWLTNTLPHLPSLMKSYIQKQTTIRHGGPYRFLLDASNVLVDPLLLSRYLRLIYIPRKIEPVNCDTQLLDLLKAGAVSANSYDYEACYLLYSACMSSIKSTSNLPPTFRSQMYDNLGRIEIQLHGPTPKVHRLFQSGCDSALKLKNPQDRILMLSRNLSDHLLASFPTVDTVRELMKGTERALDIIQSLPRRSSDRAGFIMKIHRFRANLILKFNLRENINAEIDELKQSFKIIEDNHTPSVFPSTGFHEMERQMLYLKLIANSKARRKPDECDLARYQNIQRVSASYKIYTIALAKLIAENYFKSNHLDEGVEFLTDALAHHACLHQFYLYRRIVAIRQRMLTKM